MTAKPALNKSSLKRERDQLHLYQQYLPSLDLKRRQFLAELKKAREQSEKTLLALQAVEQQAQAWLPFLADSQLQLSGLVKVAGVRLAEENLLGIKLPVLDALDFTLAPYSFLTSPVWFETLVIAMQEVLTLRVRGRVEVRRRQLLEEALQVITQRVNLFDKLLIPSAANNIRHIRISLSDMERAGVVRSKLAKSKRQKH